MQRSPISSVLVFGFSLCIAGQATMGWQARQPEITITISPSRVPGGQADVPVTKSEPYIGTPFAGAGAGLTEGGVPAVTFGIRSWREGDKARVVVYAVLKDTRAPAGHTETPIATFTMSPGESVEVPETDQWSQPRFVVSATSR
jgi:hypothetical protein